MPTKKEAAIVKESKSRKQVVDDLHKSVQDVLMDLEFARKEADHYKQVLQSIKTGIEDNEKQSRSEPHNFTQHRASGVLAHVYAAVCQGLNPANIE